MHQRREQLQKACKFVAQALAATQLKATAKTIVAEAKCMALPKNFVRLNL